MVQRVCQRGRLPVGVGFVLVGPRMWCVRSELMGLYDSATFDAFHPNVAFHDGSLDPSGGWFGSVPLIRGQV